MMKKHTRRVLRLFVVCVISAVVLSETSAAYATWLLPEQRLTTNSADQRWPEISGTKVVYEDYRNAHDVGDEHDPTTLYDIYVLDLTTGKEKCLTPYHTAVGKPAISGDRVVWEDYGHGTTPGGIYYHNLKDGKTKRLPITSGRELEISGNRVAYEAFRGGHWRVYVYDLSTGVEKRITTDAAIPGTPDIYRTKVVWQDFRDGNHEIYLYDLATGKEKRLTDNPGRQTLPKISGSNVVWIDDRNGGLNYDIYLYNLTSGTEKQITTDGAHQWFPDISGSTIVWEDERNGHNDIYLYDLTTGRENRVTDDPGYEGRVTVSGSRIVYEGALRAGITYSDIYLTRIAVPTVSAKASTVVSYNAKSRVTGSLKSATGGAMALARLTLQVSTDKSKWTNAATTTTNGSGSYTLYTPALTTARYVRVRYAGGDDHPAAVSSTLLVKPKVYFSSAPRFSTYTQRYGSTYKVWGYFKPKHSSGSTQMKVRAYRYQKRSDGTWGFVYKRTYSTKTSNPAGSRYTKYTGYVKLPYRGTWRLRAYHAADSKNAKTYSGYLYVAVP